MRAYSTGELDYLARRTAYKARVLVWVVAKDGVTGDPAPAGLWNGDHDRTFVIGGESRLYAAAGGLLQVAPIVYQVGLDPRTHRIQLSPLDPAVAQLFRGYDTRLAPVEVHRALMDPETGDLIAEPRRLIKGRLDKAPIPTPEIGGQVTIEAEVVTSLIDLQSTGTTLKSDAQQRLRSGDRFRRYNAISGEIPVTWGTGKPFIPPKPKKRRPLRRPGKSANWGGSND
jgi:hypothetical protein